MQQSIMWLITVKPVNQQSNKTNIHVAARQNIQYGDQYQTLMFRFCLSNAVRFVELHTQNNTHMNPEVFQHTLYTTDTDSGALTTDSLHTDAHSPD